MNSFSAKNRAVLIQQVNNTSFDVLIIGGGITGAGIALDASARGLKVALIDMQDFAAGTSGRSTKLIHGGLRYLKQLEFKLVAEVGKEREILHRNAPHLAKPEPMLLPIIKNGSLGKFFSRIGMWIYEWLAGVQKNEGHKILSVDETLRSEPLLKKNELLAGILFYEYRTDDARLTIEVLKEAVNRGALALNYMKAVSFIYEKDKITGAKIVNQINGTACEIRATYIVNASGPWVDELDNIDNKTGKHKLHITKGVHLVIDHKKLPIKQSVYFDTPDKRMMFAIPRERKTYIGTTDTFYDGDVANPQITIEDRDYILKCVNERFPAVGLKAEDIESGWAGLRPLINKPGKGPSEISRKDEIFISESGLLTIAGGKLTGYRKMAQRIVDLVAKRIYVAEGIKIPECNTDHIQLSGGQINGASNFSAFVKNKIIIGLALGLTKDEAEAIINRYGSNVDELYKIMGNLKNEKSEIPLMLRAQLIYAIENEMCFTPSDFFIRRIGALYFDIATVQRWKEELARYMQNLLSWNESWANKIHGELQKAIDEINKLKQS